MDIDQPKLIYRAFQNEFSFPAWRVAFNLSAIAYCHPDEAIPRLKKLGWDAEFISIESADLYVLNSLPESTAPPITVFAARGSEKLIEDWWRNFKFLRVQSYLTNYYDHSGYHEAWQLLKRQAMRQLRSNYIFFTGHSAGGGIVRSALLDMLNDPQMPPSRIDDPKYALYDFGSPATYNYEARNLVNGYLRHRCWRTVNEVDAIPNLGGIRAQHAGQLLYLGNYNVYFPPHVSYRLFWNKLRAHLSYQPLERVKDHLIPAYGKEIFGSRGFKGTDLLKHELKYLKF